jgi:uncharacterized protein YggU (UPF0235/DUF167 family)
MAVSVMIWVHPGARQAAVGGVRGTALIVRVTARAVEGKATEAALRAVADALGVRRAQVRLMSGQRTRAKLLLIDGDHDELDRKLSVLRAQPSH